ncbi:proteoglycan 4b isoform X1 [Xyrauchen texanus]|uniref:proteoglycan 4b isoform X1 n=2 Tax=Xyrauchen texanus TaxID=154827 RepID=UPI0022424363|nr:proteoglycan 4b isoform X1 [Xyrauchen texanus]
MKTTEMATYLSFLLLYAYATFTSCADLRSCEGRCGEGYYRGSLCQCDYECLGLNECCADFQAMCTTKDSCKGRCGEPFNRGNPCHCDIDCVGYNQCCPDYESMCLVEESSNEEMTNEEGIAGAEEFQIPEDEMESGATSFEATDTTTMLPADENLEQSTTQLPSEEMTTSSTNQLQEDTTSARQQSQEETTSLVSNTPSEDNSSKAPTEGSTSAAPTAEGSTRAAPTAEGSTRAAPTTEGPSSSAPTTEGPSSSAPTTEGPSSAAPTTEGSTRAVPTTEGPSSSAPTTEGPSSAVPKTEGPTSAAPPTEGPTSAAPTTEGPTSAAPTTEGSTSAAPTTEGSTSAAPTTEGPTSAASTTEGPTSAAPTTEGPTSAAPTTEGPTSAIQTEDPISTIPTEGPTSAAPTEGPKSAIPTEDPKSAMPTEGPTSAGQTEGPTIAIPTEGPKSEIPTEGPTSAATKQNVVNEMTTKAQGEDLKDSSSLKDSSATPLPQKMTTTPSPVRPTKKPLKPNTDKDDKINTKDYQADDYDTNLCSGRPVSGLTTLKNGTIVVFRGHYFWTLNKNRYPEPAQLITSVWGIPSPIDTLYTRCNCQGKSYFFKGNNYWRFENDMMDPGFPKPISQGFGRLGPITAALSIPAYRSRKESVIFFKRGGMAQKYTYQITPKCGGKPRIPVFTVRKRARREAAEALGKVISIKRSWRGFPTMVTSSVSVPSRVKEGYKYYVFSQKKYYSMKMEREKPVILTPAKGPKEKSANSFFKCPETLKN